MYTSPCSCEQHRRRDRYVMGAARAPAVPQWFEGSFLATPASPSHSSALSQAGPSPSFPLRRAASGVPPQLGHTPISLPRPGSVRGQAWASHQLSAAFYSKPCPPRMEGPDLPEAVRSTLARAQRQARHQAHPLYFNQLQGGKVRRAGRKGWR